MSERRTHQQIASLLHSNVNDVESGVLGHALMALEAGRAYADEHRIPSRNVRIYVNVGWVLEDQPAPELHTRKALP